MADAESSESNADSQPSKNSNKLKVTLISIVVFFCSCCGLPYSCLYVTAPTTWIYHRNDPVYLAPPLSFEAYLRGSNDYSLDYTGPRSLVFKANSPKRTNTKIRILSARAIGSIQGEFELYDPTSMPLELEFERTGSIGRFPAAWVSDLELDTEPSSGEEVRVLVEFEVLLENGEAIPLIYDETILPRKIHRPIGHLIPSV